MPRVKSLFTYPLHVEDVLLLPQMDGAREHLCPYPAILLGDSERNIPDMRLCSPDVIHEAVGSDSYIETHIYYQPSYSVWNLPLLFFRKARKARRRIGSNVYRIDPNILRESGLERGVRTRENAYAFTGKQFAVPEEKRAKRFKRLEKSLVTQGWDAERPVSVMLCRSYGVRDTMADGHHRLSLVLKHQITPITLRFVYASQLPFLSRLPSRKLRVNR